jgi:hypothetical protein
MCSFIDLVNQDAVLIVSRRSTTGAGMYRGDCVPGEGGDVIRYVLRSLDGTVSNLRGDGGDASARPAGLQYFAVRNSVGTDVLYSRTEILSSAKTQWGLVSRL